MVVAIAGSGAKIQRTFSRALMRIMGTAKAATGLNDLSIFRGYSSARLLFYGSKNTERERDGKAIRVPIAGRLR
jgi:hypothetical protein